MEILDVTIIFGLLHFSKKACPMSAAIAVGKACPMSAAIAVGTQKRVIELIDSDLWQSDSGPDNGSVRYRSVNAEPNSTPDTFVSVVEKCLGQDFG
jgi:hypothetical protein